MSSLIATRAGAVTPAEREEDMKYTYGELQTMLNETEKEHDENRNNGK